MKLPKVWKTKTGAKLKIKDMSTSHIENCLAMLERNYAKICNQHSLDALAYACSTSAEMASYCAEQESENLMEEAYNQERMAEEYPVYQSLSNELEKRNKHDKIKPIHQNTPPKISRTRG